MQSATYCPEDNKLRLYVGRVPKEEYLALRAEGWTSTPKQSCDFVATWTPTREDRALSYSDGIIDDEDQTPEQRAADRAERFSGYRDKRLGEAVGLADRFDAGPAAHGFQDYGRAVRSADRHDRIGGKAVNAWDKAEYWQSRTAGVISHALYKAEPGVRMGRIKTLEAEQRKQNVTLETYRQNFAAWSDVASETDPEKQHRKAFNLSNYGGGGYYKHPRPETVTNDYAREHGQSLYDMLVSEKAPITGAEAAALWLSGAPDPESEEFFNTAAARWSRHYINRLAYENQMLAACGGMLEQKDVEPGGRIAGKLILKVAKSPVTKRATSVQLLGEKVHGWTYKARNIPGTDWAEYQLDLERIDPHAYKAPTEESLAELAAVKAKIKAGAPKSEISLVNPTLEEAEKLQALWNEQALKAHNASPNAKYSRDFTPTAVSKLTQAEYSERAKGAYASAKTASVCGNGKLWSNYSGAYGDKRKQWLAEQGPALVNIRITSAGNDSSHYAPKSVVHITDKAAKPLPQGVWEPVSVAAELVEA